MNTNTGKYFFIPDWLLQENSQTIHAYIYILNEINNNGAEFKTSYRNIAKELNLSLQNFKTILKTITQQSTHNITQQSTHNKTLLSIDFIGVLKETKTISDTVKKTHTTEQKTQKQPTNSFDFRKSLIDYGFKNNLVDDWLKVRKTKKATNTETAFKSFITEIESRQCNINEMLQTSVTNSWSGFKHKWIDNLKIQQQSEKQKEEKIGRTSLETIKKNAEYNGQY
jgi:hypothetical protein